MINAITYGLGPELGKAVRIEYYKVQDRIKRQVDDLDLDGTTTVLVADMVALACFRSMVLSPIEGSVNFIRGIKKFEVHSVQMGAYSLDKKFSKDVNDAVKSFYAILNEYEIDILALDVSDPKKFVHLVLNMMGIWSK